jgi:hypothetical protein
MAHLPSRLHIATSIAAAAADAPAMSQRKKQRTDFMASALMGKVGQLCLKLVLRCQVAWLEHDYSYDLPRLAAVSESVAGGYTSHSAVSPPALRSA